MQSAVVEGRYKTVRARLHELHYDQPLSLESSELAERMLDDLVGSKDEVDGLKVRDAAASERLSRIRHELNVLEAQVPQLREQNDSLHLELLEAGEASGGREELLRTRTWTLEEEAEAAQAAFCKAEHAREKLERELEILRDEVAALLPPAPAPRLAVSWPEAQRTAAGTPSARADAASEAALHNRSGVLLQSLRRCEAQIRQLEEERMQRTLYAEREAATEVAQAQRSPYDADGAPPHQRSPTRERRETAWGTDGAEAIARDRRRADLEHECHTQQIEQGLLRSRITELRHREREATDQAGLALQSTQERERAEGLRTAQARALHQEQLSQCAQLHSENQELKDRLARERRAASVAEEVQARIVRELQAKLAELRGRNEEEGPRSAARLQQLEQRLEAARADGQRAAEAESALEAEVAAAEADSRRCLSELEERAVVMEDQLLGGSLAQQHSHRAGVQVQLLQSSLDGTAGEQKFLAALLQQRRQALNAESMKCLGYRLQAQRAAAQLESLEAVRGDWTRNLDRAVRGLQRAHSSLASTQRLRDASRESHARLRREVSVAEDNATVAREQCQALASEVSSMQAQAAYEERRCAHLGRHAEQLRAELGNLEAEISRAAQGELLGERRAGEGTERLEGLLQRALMERNRSERARQEESLRMRQHIVDAESSMSQMHAELEELLLKHETLVTEVTQAGTRRCSREEQVQAATLRLREVEARLEELEEKEVETSGQRKEADASAERHREHREQQEQLAAQLAAGCARLSRAVGQQSAECRHRLLLEEVSSEELTTASARLASMEAQRLELHSDVEELLTLVSSSEARREELGTELRLRQQQVRQAQEVREAEAVQGDRRREDALTSEIRALWQAATELDAERDERHRVADVRCKEISDEAGEIAAQRQALLDGQSALDDVESTVQTQGQRLTYWRHVLAEHQAAFLELQEASSGFREEALENSTEARAIEEDLMHMTKQNQALHEEIRIQEQCVTALVTSTKEQLLEQETCAQQRKTIELELDDVLRLHQQAKQQILQQEAMLERLKAEGDRVRRALGDLAADLRRGLEQEEECRVRTAQSSLDLSLLEGQVEDVASRLQQAEAAHKEALEEDACLEANGAAAAAARQGASQRELVTTHARHHLSAQKQQLQHAVQRARNDAASQQRQAEEGWAQARGLEVVLAEERLRLRHREAENQALQQCFAAQRGALSPLASTSLGSSATARAEDVEVAALRQDVERGYAEVGEADAARERALSEVLRLRQALKSPPTSRKGA